MSRLSWLRDRFWPHLDALTDEQKQEEVTKQQKILDAELAVVGELLARSDLSGLQGADVAATQLVAAEDERQGRVESRLMVVFGLATISATVPVGIMTAILNAGGGRGPKLIVMAGLATYLVLQAARAGLAAVKGVGRRGRTTPHLDDLVPTKDEGKEDFLARRVVSLVRLRDELSRENARRVDQMALAHEAVANLLCGAVLFISVLFVVSVCGAMSPTEDVIARLRR